MKTIAHVLILFGLLSCASNEDGKECNRQVCVLLVNGKISQSNFQVEDEKLNITCCYNFINNLDKAEANSRVIEISFVNDSTINVKALVIENGEPRTRGNLGQYPIASVLENVSVKKWIHDIYLKAWYKS